MKLKIKICTECNEPYLCNHICKGKKRPQNKRKKAKKQNLIIRPKRIFDIKTCEICGEKYLYDHQCPPEKLYLKFPDKEIIRKYKELKTLKKTANYFGISGSYIHQVIKKYNIKKPTEKKICPICNKEFKSKNSRHIYCSKKCLKIAYENNNLNNSKNQIRFKVFLRDNFTCIYCGRSTFEHNIELHLEHINPKSKNGDDNINNYATSCKDCNLSKHDILLPKNIKDRITKEIKLRNKDINWKQMDFCL